mmetsp:Transcript_155/g.512  ORF Transcript_155/g.512 Transcript_155/m.512 type:complete len:317 (+) Transcript_155:251-1201(+)
MPTTAIAHGRRAGAVAPPVKQRVRVGPALRPAQLLREVLALHRVPAGHRRPLALGGEPALFAQLRLLCAKRCKVGFARLHQREHARRVLFAAAPIERHRRARARAVGGDGRRPRLWAVRAQLGAAGRAQRRGRAGAPRRRAHRLAACRRESAARRRARAHALLLVLEARLDHLKRRRTLRQRRWQHRAQLVPLCAHDAREDAGRRASMRLGGDGWARLGWHRLVDAGPWAQIWPARNGEHQLADLGAHARPVLGRGRVQRGVVDAQLHERVERVEQAAGAHVGLGVAQSGQANTQKAEHRLELVARQRVAAADRRH